MSESFFVLSGTVRLYDGEGWRSATAGDFLYVPPGGIHGFRNESGEPASMLILFAPGAPREAYFEGIQDLPSMSEEEKAAFFLRHDNIWVEG
jgi:mannose-6-phosphate isomerase-like protein (cupin superfamily)